MLKRVDESHKICQERFFTLNSKEKKKLEIFLIQYKAYFRTSRFQKISLVLFCFLLFPTDCMVVHRGKSLFFISYSVSVIMSFWPWSFASQTSRKVTAFSVKCKWVCECHWPISTTQKITSPCTTLNISLELAEGCEKKKLPVGTQRPGDYTPQSSSAITAFCWGNKYDKISQDSVHCKKLV